MDVLLFALNLAWKILVVCMGWMLFKYVLKNGSGTFKEILETIGLALRTFGHWIRKCCLSYLRKEESAEKKGKTDIPASNNPETVKKEEPVEVSCGRMKIQYPTFEEFSDAFRNGKLFTLK